MGSLWVVLVVTRFSGSGTRSGPISRVASRCRRCAARPAEAGHYQQSPSLRGLEHDLPQVHHRDAGFGLRLYRERVLAGLLDLERADVARLEVLESAGVLDGERQPLVADRE